MTDGDQALNLIYLAGFLVIVVSALAARRIPLRHGLRMAVAWVLIFAAVFLVVAAKDEIVALGKRVIGGGSQGAVVEAGGQVRIRQAADGHFWVYGRINGEKVHFLIDSGATFTSISARDARRSHLDDYSEFPSMVETANGVIAVRQTQAKTVKVGSIVRHDLTIHVSEAFGDTNVLGMNFLSSLKRWGVEGPWLVLEA